MSSRFESDSYISVIASEDFGVKFLKAIIIIGEGKSFAQHFAFGGLDKAVMLVQHQYRPKSWNSNPFKINSMLNSTKPFAPNPRAKWTVWRYLTHYQLSKELWSESPVNHQVEGASN